MSEPTDDFATMFEASIQAKRFEKGQTIEGTIVAIGPEVALVDVGGKGEATIDVDELKDDEGDLEVAVGDRIQAVGGVDRGRADPFAETGATGRDRAAARRRVPHRPSSRRQGRKGGERRVRGAHRAASAPSARSRRSTPSAPDPAAHEGRVYEFRIIEFKEGGKNLVVSRRALLEEQQRASAAEVRRSIVAGDVMTGRVASVRDFGAFIDLGGGVQGLLHVSEMGWSRVSDTSQMVKPGDEITVKVLRVDEDKQKIALGLKQLSADPWSRVARNVRGRPGAHGPRHAPRRLRRVRRARAGRRRTGARVHVRADGTIGGLVHVRSRRA